MSQTDVKMPPTDFQSNQEDHADDGNGYEDDTDTDEDEQALKAKQPRKISERRRRQNAILDAHLYKKVKEQNNLAPPVLPGEEDRQSIKWLMKQSESYKVISTPREYQVELFERAKERNIIAVLDTGKSDWSLLVSTSLPVKVLAKQ